VRLIYWFTIEKCLLNRILWPTAQVLKLFELSRLNTVFTIWNEEHHTVGVRSQAASQSAGL
jgi:hypothetical protein